MKILIVSGSLRKKSYNTSVAHVVYKYLKQGDMSVRVVTPEELQLPLYNSDITLEQFPESITNLKKSVEESDIIVWVTPEYNHSIPGLLKNAIDWLSAGGKNSLDGKVAAIMGVSTGIFGTVRAQAHLREILSALRMFVLPLPEVFVGSATQMFNEQNELTDEKANEKIKLLLDETIAFAKKIKTEM